MDRNSNYKKKKEEEELYKCIMASTIMASCTHQLAFHSCRTKAIQNKTKRRKETEKKEKKSLTQRKMLENFLDKSQENGPLAET